MQVDAGEMRSGANRSYNAASFAMEVLTSCLVPASAPAFSAVSRPRSRFTARCPRRTATTSSGCASTRSSRGARRQGTQDRVGLRRHGGTQRRGLAFGAVTQYPSLTHISIGALIGRPVAIRGRSTRRCKRGSRCDRRFGPRVLQRGCLYRRDVLRVRAGADAVSGVVESGQRRAPDQRQCRGATRDHPVDGSARPAARDRRGLEHIAANLAEAQRFSGLQIDTLNTELHYIDALIDQALDHEQDTSALEDNAISVTASVLHQVEGLRDDYGAKLEASLTDLRAEHGYDPAPIEDVDGDGEPGPSNAAGSRPTITTPTSAPRTRPWSTAAAR